MDTTVTSLEEVSSKLSELYGIIQHNEEFTKQLFDRLDTKTERIEDNISEMSEETEVEVEPTIEEVIEEIEELQEQVEVAPEVEEIHEENVIATPETTEPLVPEVTEEGTPISADLDTIISVLNL